MTEHNQAHIDAYFDSHDGGPYVPSSDELAEFLTMLAGVREAAETSIHGRNGGKPLSTDPAELAKTIVTEDLAGGNSFQQTQQDLGLLAMLETGYVTFLGKTMLLTWPDGKPENFDAVVEIIMSSQEDDFRAPEDPMDSPDLTK